MVKAPVGEKPLAAMEVALEMWGTYCSRCIPATRQYKNKKSIGVCVSLNLLERCVLQTYLPGIELGYRLFEEI